MCTHLSKRGSTYYFRRRVLPESLIPFVGKREWLISLRTKDRSVAKRLIPDFTKATDAELDRARDALAAVAQPAAPDQAPAGSPAPAMALRREEVEAGEFFEREAAEQEGRREARAARVEALARRLRLPTRDMPEDDAAIADLLRAERERAEEAEQRAAMAEAQARVAKAKRETPASATTEPALEGKPVPLEPLLDDYAAEYGSRAKRGFASSQTHVRSLRDFLPSDDARLATPARMIAWKDYLLRPEADDGKGLSAKTVRDGYLATVRALFAWAAMNGRIEGNPVQGLKVRVVAKPKVRERAFTDAEAAKVLAATLKPRPTLAKPYQRACRWVPWLLAYTGARVGEIAQLRAEDVAIVDGVYVLNITPEAGSVKTGKYRHVPLHPHLIEMGFLDAAKGSGPLFYDPKAATRRTEKASKSLAEKVGQKLRDMVREEGIGPEQVEQPNHAWRHRFKTKARRWKLDTEAAHHIQGHAVESEGQGYGSWPVERLAEEIAKLPPYKVPGL